MLVTRIANRLADHVRKRRTMLDLRTLSDRQLADIGVTRHDLFAPASSR